MSRAEAAVAWRRTVVAQGGGVPGALDTDAYTAMETSSMECIRPWNAWLQPAGCNGCDGLRCSGCDGLQWSQVRAAAAAAEEEGAVHGVRPWLAANRRPLPGAPLAPGSADAADGVLTAGNV